MASITDPKMSDRFASAMEEIHNNHLKMYSDISDTTAELSQSHRQFVKTALDACLKKCKDDEKLFEKIQEFKKDLEQNNKVLKEKQRVICEGISEVHKKEMQKNNMIQKIEKLTEEQTKRKELIKSQNEANKNRLRNLQKARLMFQDHLGLEIRAVMDKTQVVKSDKFQFVFQNINPSDQNDTYVITMGIKENGSYQIVSSDPVLDCLPVLESRLQATKNLPAFLANVRKEFVSKARC